jgi:hypothetical protein
MEYEIDLGSLAYGLGYIRCHRCERFHRVDYICSMPSIAPTPHINYAHITPAERAVDDAWERAK